MISKNMNRIFNFTNTYDPEKYEDFSLIDCSGLSGTDMYLDDEAHKKISHLIKDSAPGKPYSGIHLIDSGNYHYMTRLFTEFIDEPYDLLFFDNHTDMKPAMFDMLSCGSWAEDVLKNDPNLRKIFMIGPSQKSISELSEDVLSSEKLVAISAEELEKMAPSEIFQRLAWAAPVDGEARSKNGGSAIALYISIDKDVISSAEIETNWDQGSLSLAVLLKILEEICKSRKILGADICGLLPESAGRSRGESGAVKYSLLESDLKIIEVLKKYV